MSSELELLKQCVTELEAKNDKLEAENVELRKGNTGICDLRFKLSVSDAEIAELKRRNAEALRANAKYNEMHDAKNVKLKARIEELESENVEFRDRLTKVEQKQAERESKKNRKFQIRCIQIAKKILNKEPIIKYHSPFLNGLELDAFFQKYR